jgi:hypothetical protein
VAALAVVEDLEVFEDRVGQLKAGAPLSTVQELCLHSCPEGLHHAVVIRVADASHRERETGGLDPLAESPRGELAGVIAVHNSPGGWLAVLDRHRERTGDQRGGLAAVDRPADYAPRMGVQDSATVELALASRMLGYVREPQLVRRVTSELPGDQIARGSTVALGSARRLPLRAGRPWMPRRRMAAFTALRLTVRLCIQAAARRSHDVSHKCRWMPGGYR